eukprot:UN22539
MFVFKWLLLSFLSLDFNYVSHEVCQIFKILSLIVRYLNIINASRNEYKLCSGIFTLS